MILIAALAPLITIAITTSNSRSMLARRDRDWSVVNTACDSALEYAFAAWKDWVKTNGGAVPLAQHLAGQTYESRPGLTVSTSTIQTQFDATKKFGGVTLTSLSIEALDASGLTIPSTTSLTGDAQRTAMRCLLPLESLPRRVGRAYTYRVVAQCQQASRGGAGPITVRSERYFRKSDATVWQAMMFFDGDLELFPTPAMPITGWIHTNSNAYLAHASNTFDLTMNGDFTFSGSPSTISKGANATLQDARGLIYGVTYLQQLNEPGWSSWKAPVWNAGGLSAQVDFQSSKLEPFAEPRANIINTADANLNNDSLREIIERPVDTIAAGGNGDGKRTAGDDTAAFKDRRYYNVADIKIIVNRSLSTVGDRIKILDKNDNRLTDTFATNLVDQALGKNATTGLPATKDFYDYREAGNITSSSASAADSTAGHVTTTDIDVSKLTPLLNGYAGYATGVVYFKDETPTGTAGVNNKKAARLVKGGSLPNLGMTFVTEDGAYIQGDYNTGSTYNATTGALTAQPPSNGGATADPAQNTYGGYTVKPAAVCADAVTFLSNAWSNTYGYTTATSGRVGSATTYNTAFMSGHVKTNTGYESGTGANVRSGGGINFPRVLENWNGNALTYWGSMVQLFESQVFNTTWTSNIYGAPKRPWNFENRFLNTPPPGPLEFVEYTRGRFLRPLN